MNSHLLQAKHNENFHDFIANEEGYYDWKITILFYVSIHYLKALAIKRKANIGFTHYDIEKSVNPKSQSKVLIIPNFAWNDYKMILNYSKTARYDGIENHDFFNELKKIDYKNTLTHFNNFKSYIKNQIDI